MDFWSVAQIQGIPQLHMHTPHCMISDQHVFRIARYHTFICLTMAVRLLCFSD